ncbi:MAG: NAD(P)/FAD-dependent oxidoreductase [Thermodesulfobacteriota bacterium]
MKEILIIGSGFAGLNAAKVLAGQKDANVTILDRNNYHLFQPLLYQVATAGLSPAEIAVPIRSLFPDCPNVRVFQGEVSAISPENRRVQTDIGDFHFDYLIMACGARHFYFGNDAWEEFAPGLKTIEQAVEIRRRILSAFEKAETASDIRTKTRLLTFLIVGGGSTGVELAGAIAELSRFTFARDFRNIDPAMARILLVEAGPRILPAFPETLSDAARLSLEGLGVQVRTSRKVARIDPRRVDIGGEIIEAETTLWAAGIQASALNRFLGGPLDSMGRIMVEPDLSLKGHPNIFAAGDQAHAADRTGRPLPANAPVALQQGRFVARTILRDLRGRKRKPFRYRDKGQLTTIGRKKAVMAYGRIELDGFWAWAAWLFVHIYYLMGFKNRMFVFLQWTISYLNYAKGARLIVNKGWRFYGSGEGIQEKER